MIKFNFLLKVESAKYADNQSIMEPFPVIADLPSWDILSFFLTATLVVTIYGKEYDH